MRTSDIFHNFTLAVLCASLVMIAGCSCTPAKVPNVAGMTQAEASSAITDAGLTVGAVTHAYSATVTAGNVISQYPAAGSSVQSGMPVALTVSQGPQPIAVPNLAGLTQAAASAAVTGAGLTVGTVTPAYSDTVALGHVISQSPIAGSSVDSGSPVAFAVSQGPPPVTVPNVVGRALTPASAAITGAGLAVGTVTRVYSSTVASGNVVSQNPAAGTGAALGTPVALVVSQGPQPVEVPDVVGLPQAAASAALADAGLVVGTVTQAYSAAVTLGSVISQNPEGGASAVPGTSVSIMVSLGPQPVAVPNVVGQAQAAAFAAIVDAGLAVGTVVQAYSSSIVSGSVISQSPSGGSSVIPGSAVNLVVSQGPQPVTVPDVVGRTQAAASVSITDAGLVLGAVTQAYSSTVVSGSVISQTPGGGSFAIPGSAVSLVVSQGPPPVTVPDVVGMTPAAASAAITGAGLVVGAVTQAYSSTVAQGNVASQSPSAGSSAVPGSVVSLVVSLGPQPVTVPDVVGMAQAAASATLLGVGLVVGTVTSAHSATVAPGCVISQAPEGGCSVFLGSVVNLVISAGQQAVTVPNVAGMTLAAAQTALTDGGLTLGTLKERHDATVPAGRVISQDPAAGQTTAAGSAVDLVLSMGPDDSMVSVPAGTFMMGNSGAGDDATYGQACEFPAHHVTLGAYQIGKYKVTNGQYCDVLNWALARGYLKTSAGAAWQGMGDIYAGGNLQCILRFGSVYCGIRHSDGVFAPKTRAGLPGSTNYSMDTHPVVQVTWFGAVAYCNWLNEMQGLAPCYDMNTADWPLTVAPPAAGGYRLPTEAEWERAAAWDGTKHWIYGFSSDSFDVSAKPSRCNYDFVDEWYGIFYTNPLGLVAYPYSSPVGWFNGVNISPGGKVATVDSVSPAGCYDMSGNAWDWCHDWYLDSYYYGGDMTNPTGPMTRPGPVSTRVLRGGALVTHYTAQGDAPILNYLRTAARDNYYETTYADTVENRIGFGFRIARTP